MRSLCGRIFMGLAVIVVAIASGCETEFEVNTENKDEPVVYCVLNSSSDIQYLKINKTYILDRAAVDNPPMSDSVYFDGNIEIVLERWEGSRVKDIHIFEPTNEIQKDTGFFPDDNNIIYRTNARIIPESKYSLSIYLEDKERIVYAETESLGELKVIDPLGIPERKISLNTGQNYNCSWKPVNNAGIYQVVLNFHYMEYEGNDSVRKTVVWPQAYTSPLTNAESLSKEISGSRFYYIIRDKIPEKEGVVRKAMGLDFEFLSGGQEIKYYIESTAPAEGALMEKPIYTNLTNGIGVFSTVSSATISMLPLGAVTLDSLAYSQLTGHLGFLDHNGQRSDQ